MHFVFGASHPICNKNTHHCIANSYCRCHKFQCLEQIQTWTYCVLCMQCFYLAIFSPENGFVLRQHLRRTYHVLCYFELFDWIDVALMENSCWFIIFNIHCAQREKSNSRAPGVRDKETPILHPPSPRFSLASDEITRKVMNFAFAAHFTFH